MKATDKPMQWMFEASILKKKIWCKALKAFMLSPKFYGIKVTLMMLSIIVSLVLEEVVEVFVPLVAFELDKPRDQDSTPIKEPFI